MRHERQPLPILLLLMVGLMAMANAAADGLDERLATILRGATWGSAVRDLASGELLGQVNADQALIPASNQKLVTMAAGLLELGPEYRSRTEFLVDGPIVDGTLRGNLIVAGYGAITFTARHRDDLTIEQRQRLLDEQLSWLAYQLRQHGIRRIEGRLIADCSAYTDMPENHHYPCAGPLSFNENTLDVVVRNGRITTLPDHLVSFAVRAVDGNFAQRKQQVNNRLTDTILVNPSRDSVDYWRLDGMGSQAFHIAHLTWNLTRRGLAIEGRDLRGGERQMLFSLPGLSLRELLPPIGIDSDNFRAEMLYLNLVYELKGSANYRLGPAALGECLTRHGLLLPTMTAADGSGLSRNNRISAADLTILMRHLHASEHRDLVLNSLPVAGRTGTLRNQLDLPGIGGELRAKTGSLNGVRALTGIHTTRSGRTVAFSFLCNDLKDTAAYWRAVAQALTTIHAL